MHDHVYKVVELVGSSETSIEDAVQGAIARGLRQGTGPKERHTGVFWGVYVRPGARGRGLAAGLIAGIIERAQPLVEQLSLSVVQGNAAAIALYRRHGFTVYGVEPRARKHLG